MGASWDVPANASMITKLSPFASALAGDERFFEIMDEAEELPDKGNASELTSPKGEVEFRNVSFSYNAGSDVLKNINFRVKPGEVIALVGETRAGKTTIVNLLIRFYELTSGKILIDNTDITDILRTEKEIQKAFLTLLRNHTSFLIAHRLSTIRDADKIMVIGNGEILESGTHEELMKKEGAYYRMVMSHMGYDLKYN